MTGYRGSPLLLLATLLSLVLMLSCGGGPPYLASKDMTMEVNPSSITVSYQKTVQSQTGTGDIYITIKDQQERPVPNITVYARIDSTFLGVISFEKCPGLRECSCTTDETGACFITFTYKYGTTHGDYKAEFLIYSGPLTDKFTLSTQKQG